MSIDDIRRAIREATDDLNKCKSNKDRQFYNRLRDFYMSELAKMILSVNV